MIKVLRFLTLGFLIITTIVLLWLPSALLNPIYNVDSLAAFSQYDPTLDTLRSSGGYLKFYSSGYILVLYTGSEKRFSPAEFLLISKTKNHLEIQLITGPGQEKVLKLSDGDALNYLTEHQIQLDKIESVYFNRYR